MSTMITTLLCVAALQSAAQGDSEETCTGAKAAVAPALSTYPAAIVHGELQPGETRTSELWLLNTGLEHLDLRDVDSGCGCTEAARLRALHPRPRGSAQVRRADQGRREAGCGEAHPHPLRRWR